MVIKKRKISFESELRKWNAQARINKGSPLTLTEKRENRRYLKKILR